MTIWSKAGCPRLLLSRFVVRGLLVRRLHQTRFRPRGLILVNQVLGGSLIELLNGNNQNGLRCGRFASSDGGASFLEQRFQRRSLGFVPHAAMFRRPTCSLRALCIRHGLITTSVDSSVYRWQRRRAIYIFRILSFRRGDCQST